MFIPDHIQRAFIKANIDSLVIGYRADVTLSKSVNNVWTMYAVITYTPAVTGWGHKFIGVPGVNIANVNGVPLANIASIKGVVI